MRGRNPQSLCLNAGDEMALRRIADSQTRPWYQVRRARTVLGIAIGQRVQRGSVLDMVFILKSRKEGSLVAPVAYNLLIIIQIIHILSGL